MHLFWRRIHLAIDADSPEVQAVETTDRRRGDSAENTGGVYEVLPG